MHVKSIVLIAVLTGAMMSLAPVTLRAQSNHQSDVAGVIVTGGDIAGGIFAVPGQVASFTSPSVAKSVAAALQTATVALQQGAATGSPSAVSAVLLCGGGCGATKATLSAALQGTPASGLSVHADALVTALEGLAVQSAGVPSPQLAASIRAARTAFVRLVEKADAAYLTNPPAELMEVHALLTAVLKAAGGS